MDETTKLRVAFVRIMSEMSEKIIDLELRVAMLESGTERLPLVYSRLEMVNQLETAFDVDEIDELAFDVGINGDGLSGDTRARRVRDLVATCERRRITADLIDLCKQRRPSYRWPDI